MSSRVHGTVDSSEPKPRARAWHPTSQVRVVGRLDVAGRQAEWSVDTRATHHALHHPAQRAPGAAGSGSAVCSSSAAPGASTGGAAAAERRGINRFSVASYNILAGER
jgi:hypothetical protein